MSAPSPLCPTFRYRDPLHAIDWLTQVAGFEVRARMMEGERLAHAELALDGAFIMVGTVADDAFGALVGAPSADPAMQGGKAIYVVVADADAVHARARAAGGLVGDGPVDRDYGSREVTCRDPEGNLWVFGTYRPG
jgi:uncharacterized glyoxalase superfamily protein PhnB